MNQHTSVQQKQQENQQKYERTQMQREIVIQRLKEQGMQDYKAENGVTRYYIE